MTTVLSGSVTTEFFSFPALIPSTICIFFHFIAMRSTMEKQRPMSLVLLFSAERWSWWWWWRWWRWWTVNSPSIPVRGGHIYSTVALMCEIVAIFVVSWVNTLTRIINSSWNGSIPRLCNSTIWNLVRVYLQGVRVCINKTEISLVEYFRDNGRRGIFVFIFLSRHYFYWLVIISGDREIAVDGAA